MAQDAAKVGNPLIERIIDSVDAKRAAPARHRRWIADQFRQAGPRLQVRFDAYKLNKQSRIFRDVEMGNVIALLPGPASPSGRR